MLVSLKSRLNGSFQIPFLLVLLVLSAHIAFGQAQSNAADLQGTVRDTTGAVVTNATVTARNPGTNFSRSTTTNDEGFFRIVNVPPGDYEVTIEATNFKKAVLTKVTVTVGQAAELNDIQLEPGQITESVTISDATSEIVESSKTAVATTIDQQRINNLPINERNYLAFALTTSTVGRDNGRPIGPAPTTGLNFGGQRGRSNLVQVDGADNTDNSVNASRSTVSQEAVQEFQVVTNSFAAEFGRSAGGVVNVVTKSGTNELHGNLFGFLRHRSFQARNAFAPIEDPPFTRAQYGFTLGGPLDKGRTFFFFAFEQRRRNESGFFTSDVQGNLTSSVTIAGQTFRNLSPQQVAYINQLLGVGATALAVPYAFLASSGGSTALTGTNPLVIFPGLSALTPIPAGSTVGSRFLLSSAPVPSGTISAAGQPIAFRPLNNLQRIFPVTERTTFNSFRLDHLITQNHQFSFRFGYNPSEITGIQVESQNQSLGQNDFSRTGIQTLKDSSAVATLTSTLSNTIVNEARFNYGGRRATFKSQNGDAVAFNISGTAFIGRELFSPVLRTESRYEFTDNVNVVHGSHNFKFGADYASVRIPEAIFELNFAGLFNFGGLGACTLVSALCSTPGITFLPPDFTPVQQYGLGFPANFIQGFGNPVSSIGNKPMAFFAQDSWKARRNLTINYGVRYDYELTEQIPTLPLRDPLSGIQLTADQVRAAQDALGVQQGFPRDKNNWAPRLAVAWDPWGDGKTSIRGAFGMFYDHPLLAIAFNSDIADAVQQQQGILTPGSPALRDATTGQPVLLNAVQVFQGTVCSQANLSPFCQAAIPASGLPAGFQTPGVAAGAQYQFGRQRFNDQTFPGFGPVLPFTLHVQKNFEYAYANQGNFTVERELTRDMTITGSYIFVGAHHLPHPLDINAPQTELQIQNFRRLSGRNPTNTTEAIAFSIPTSGAACPFGVPLQCFTLATPAGATAYPNAGQTFAIIVPGMITAPLSNLSSRIVNAAVANFFRPSAPNYFLAQALSGGLVSPTVLNGALAGSLRTPGTISPFGSINAQTSDGNSTYHALNVDVKKRFTNNFQFLASYTWSHSIDDSSDLQTLLLPQDNRNFGAERADSLFDQRHRFVFSGVIASPSSWAKAGGFHRALSNFTLAPIFEISSGRPFNILSNQDTNNDQSNQTDRPSVLSDGTLCVPGTPGCAGLITNGQFTSGSLARNFGLTHRYISLDLRLAKLVPLGERVRLELIAEGFNLFNRFNEAAASPFITDVNLFNERANNGRYFSRPTAAFDPRQFQFGLKLNF
ncbi:MAG TPA: carboxypeptidase regulatory-like domain-containing protein [Pyrinomonadaceae bacterium]|nr:carboxypeptidase regulatory-like domain-containing protein [Pyrinomonadaceae bacterium]